MKTGVVLEGGALRTIYSAGVCDGLLAGGVMPDYLIGVSAGIAYGVSYISRQPGRNLEVATRFAPDRRYMGFGNLLRRDNRSYFGLDFTFRQIPEALVPFDYAAFEAYPGQMEAVVTNLNTGTADYLQVPRDAEGSSLVLQASCALPLMFPVFHIDGTPYLDGGISDGIPFDRAFAQGCDRVIVVLTKTREYVRKPDLLLPLIEHKYRQWPNFCRAMQQRAEIYNKSRERLFQLECEGKVLVVAPNTTRGVSRTERDVEKLRLLWADGYSQAMERMDEIKRFLG